MVTHHFSPYQLCSTSAGYLDQNGYLFDLSSYSRFKYGSDSDARIYAHHIASQLRVKYYRWQNEEVIISASAFKVAPTAAEVIAQMTYELLRESFPLLRKVKISRETVFPNDYGSLSAEERHSLMDKNIVIVDRELFRNKKLILVDDLRVTGAHENKMIAVLSGLVDEVVFTYVARLSGSFTPFVEFNINQTAVQSVANIKAIVDTGVFHVNARICKYLLSYRNTDELLSFFYEVPVEVLLRIEECVCGDGYHLMEEYWSNYSLLKEVLVNRSTVFLHAF